MAKVTAALFCPGCQTELAEPAKQCPKCGKVLAVPTSEYFELPYYLSAQMRDYAASVEDRVNNKKPLSKEEEAKFEASQKEYETWVRTLPPEEMVAAMVDAQHILRHVMHSRINAEELEQLIGRGLAIGRLAESLKSYFKAGGSSYEPETRFVPADTGDRGWSATSPAERGDR